VAELPLRVAACASGFISRQRWARRVIRYKAKPSATAPRVIAAPPRPGRDPLLRWSFTARVDWDDITDPVD